MLVGHKIGLHMYTRFTMQYKQHECADKSIALILQTQTTKQLNPDNEILTCCSTNSPMQRDTLAQERRLVLSPLLCFYFFNQGRCYYPSCPDYMVSNYSASQQNRATHFTDCNFPAEEKGNRNVSLFFIYLFNMYTKTIHYSFMVSHINNTT